MKEPISIALADDNYIYRIGFKRELKKWPHVRLIFEAEDGEELIRKLKLQRPDVVLTDIAMPKIDGIEATSIIKKEFPALLVAGLSELSHVDYITDFTLAGGNAFLSKKHLHINFEQILDDLIHTGFHFNNIFDKDSVEKVLRDNGKKLHLRDGKRFTEKEIMVMRHISKHKTLSKIADELNVSVDSIKKYKASVHHKINSKMDSEIMAYAIKMGYAEDIS